MHPDDKVLSLDDVLLRRSDVNLLIGPYWLNDQVILRHACKPYIEAAANALTLHVPSNMVWVISYFADRELLF
jgi:hypothetical protein